MYVVGIVMTSPLIVTAPVFPLSDADAVAVLCLLVPPVVKLKGEHPTKLGAVELTAAHSWMLNCIAAYG